MIDNRFFKHLAASGLSEGTIKLRRAHLERFERELAADIGAASAEALEEILGRPGWSRDYRRSLRATMRLYFGWLHATGRRDDNPALLLPKIKAAPPRPRPTPDLALAAALRDASEDEALMIRLGVEAGLRRGEVCKVHGHDLVDDLGGRSLMVTGKGDKTRSVPLSDSLARAVERRAKVTGGYLFPGAIEGHISPAWCGRRVSRLMPDGVTMHSLRHRFATRVYDATGDLLATQKLLGHSSPAVTQVYVEVDRRRLRAAACAAA
ncbi:tyrosine-type recombinase/integrase [Trueperella abortisuis]|uniref:tyrosine-type recombinase/integrase n=1 Tax=Trueperella abortisuis TaxID=445930 RepID=UPI0028936060|nr:tyrosine-type recombinase/integrase [Trueperella abortisuis]